jgi:hypothetical protein
MTMNNKRLRIHAFLFVAACSLAACANDGAEAEQSSPSPDALAQVGNKDSVRALKLVQAGKDEASRELRIKRLGEYLLGRELDQSSLQRAVRSAHEGSPDGAAGLRVTHLARNDDTLLVNGAIADDHGDGEDVGEDSARQSFENALSELAAGGAPEVQNLDLGNVKVSRLVQAAGRIGQPETLNKRVKQYIFSAPRVVGGVPIFDSNFTVGVHRNGAIASLRSSGALPDTNSDAHPSSRRLRRSTANNLHARVLRDFPGPGVHPLGLSYTLAPGSDTRSGAAEVEPREVCVVFQPLNGGSGRSRGVRVAYSVTDPDAPALYLDGAVPNDHGDPRK